MRSISHQYKEGKIMDKNAYLSGIINQEEKGSFGKYYSRIFFNNIFQKLFWKWSKNPFIQEA